MLVGAPTTQIKLETLHKLGNLAMILVNDESSLFKGTRQAKPVEDSSTSQYHTFPC